MDVFQRGSAVAFVGRIYLTVLRSRSTAQTVSLALWQGLTPDEAWFLSAVLAIWFGSSGELQKPDADSIVNTFGQSEIAGIASVLSLYRDRLVPFLRAAWSATDESEIQQSAVFFLAALAQIGVPTVQQALASPRVAAIRENFLASFPCPPELSAQFLGIPNKTTRSSGASTSSVAPAPKAAVGMPLARPSDAKAPEPAPRKQEIGKASRSERFDRAEAKPKTRSERFDSADFRTPPSLPPVPRLSAEETMVAHLFTLGYAPDEIDRIRRGPKGSA